MFAAFKEVYIAIMGALLHLVSAFASSCKSLDNLAKTAEYSTADMPEEAKDEAALASAQRKAAHAEKLKSLKISAK